MTNNNNVDSAHDGLQATNRGEIASQPLQRKTSFLRTILGRGLFKGGKSSNQQKEDVETQKRVINRSTVINNAAK